MLISKFMTSQTGKQIIEIPTIPNISKNKGNEAMKFDELIKHNGRNIFCQKLCRK